MSSLFGASAYLMISVPWSLSRDTGVPMSHIPGRLGFRVVMRECL
jgi:hypothetical protein